MILTKARINPHLKLSKNPPASLQDKSIAAAEWQRVIVLYSQTITRFDEDLLICYCDVFYEDQKMLPDLCAAWKRTIQHIEAGPVNIPGRQSSQLRRELLKAKANLAALAIRRRNKRKLLLMLAKSLCIDPPVLLGEI